MLIKINFILIIDTINLIDIIGYTFFVKEGDTIQDENKENFLAQALWCYESNTNNNHLNNIIQMSNDLLKFEYEHQ
ncbi:MAG: hypothetical protein ACO2ZM_08455 [Francisellaceae bacterium]